MDTDFGGSDLENFHNSNWLDCLTKCKAKSDCQSVTFDPFGKYNGYPKNYCYHKTAKFGDGGANPIKKDFLLSANIECFEKPFVPDIVG